MEWVNIFLLVLVAFWSIIYYAYNVKKEYFNRKGIEVSPLTIVWRIGKVEEERLKPGSKAKTLLRGLFTISIVVCLILLAYALKIYFENVIGVFKAIARGSDISSGIETPVVPIIPGVTISFNDLPYLLIALGVAIIVHEVSHAIAAIVDDVPIKSWGIALFIVIPAAFVEPVEEEFSKRELMSKARVYSAGPSANALLAVIVLGILVISIPLMFNLGLGLRVLDVVEDSPAARAGLNSSMTIVAVNGKSIGENTPLHEILLSPNSLFKVLLEELSKIRNVEGNVTLTVEVYDENVSRTLNVTVHKYAYETRIGVIVYPVIDLEPKHEILAIIKPYYLKLMLWLFIVNLGLALINATPIIITDGGRLVTDILEKVMGSKGKTFSILIQLALILILVINIVASTI